LELAGRGIIFEVCEKTCLRTGKLLMSLSFCDYVAAFPIIGCYSVRLQKPQIFKKSDDRPRSSPLSLSAPRLVHFTYYKLPNLFHTLRNPKLFSICFFPSIVNN
jgi:hypothetical protein